MMKVDPNAVAALAQEVARTGVYSVPPPSTLALSTLERTDRYITTPCGSFAAAYCPTNEVGAVYSLKQRVWTITSPISLKQFVEAQRRAGRLFSRNANYLKWYRACSEPAGRVDPTAEEIDAILEASRGKG